VFTYKPLTFYAEVDLTKPNSFNTSLGSFINFFQILEDNKQKIFDLRKKGLIEHIDEYEVTGT
jgi:hypothetical protein